MKKTLLVLLLIASLITTAFAAKGPEVMLGVSSGFSQKISFEENSSTDTGDIVPVKADALFYLGDSLALNTALGMNIYLPETDLPETDLNDPSFGFVADILAYYRLELGKTASLLVGGGLSYQYMDVLRKIGIEINNASWGCHQLDLLASLRLQLGITDNIYVFAGADVGYNVLSSMVGKSGSSSGSYEVDASIMPWAIKAGVNYKF